MLQINGADWFHAKMVETVHKASLVSEPSKLYSDYDLYSFNHMRKWVGGDKLMLGNIQKEIIKSVKF